MTAKLRLQSLVAYGRPLCETIVDCPAPAGSEVLVRIERCGVCHSDLHLQDGYFSLGDDKKLDISKGRELPFTLGHEIAGVIEAAGPQAEGAMPGRKPLASLASLSAARPRRPTPNPRPPTRWLRADR